MGTTCEYVYLTTLAPWGRWNRVKDLKLTRTDEKNTKCPIYSLSVHPDGTRLATGGLGMFTSADGRLS